MIIAIDFDGTCVTHEYPDVGADIAIQTTDGIRRGRDTTAIGEAFWNLLQERKQ